MGLFVLELSCVCLLLNCLGVVYLQASCVGLLLSNLMMDSFLCPMMNTISVHDIISNEKVLPTSPIYDSNNIGTTNCLPRWGARKFKYVNAKGHDDAYITKMCLENLQKQRFF